jgi:hypothetical protein
MSDPSLIGTWSLRHFELRFPDGRVTHPFGEAVSGYLFYNEDGFMSAAFGSAARCAGSSQDLAKVAQREAGGFDEFMAYCGRYEVKDDRIRHSVEVSSLEAWTGTVQERSYEIEGDELTLLTVPLMVGTDAPTGYLVWERVAGQAALR